MNDEERTALAERSNTLRTELKLWEKSFAAANNGQKASRDDIKKHLDIATKYKEYNKSRDILSGKVPYTDPAQRQTPRKRNHEDGHDQPSKRFQIMKTPSKASTHPWDIDPYESPSMIRKLFTPSRKTTIGPTPQKDGQVLGIFDLLEEGLTPSKSTDGPETNHLASIHATPRKSHYEAQQRTPSHARTPSMNGRTVDNFATPLTNLHPNKQTGTTPSSVSKLHFSTPSFLRRDSQRLQLPPTGNNDDLLNLSPEPVRVPRIPLVKGLSSILAGLRKIEEEAADDDLEALHEMEDGMRSKNASETNRNASTIKSIALAEENRPRLPLGGFDDEAMFDSEPEEVDRPAFGRDGKPLKAFKKRGQKRTTRLVKMKPGRAKPQLQADQPPEGSEYEQVHAPDIVLETQTDDADGFVGARNFDSDSQSEYTASEGGTRYRRPNQSKNKSSRVAGDSKPVARKANALAHQNFKRLKLRNSGAKGGAAHNSRFRRKR